MGVSEKPNWWSWKDIVEHADRLGIPNFQRGAVWSRENREALLESIYYQSPCGSFVLWEPDTDDGDPHRHGVPLRQRGFEPEAKPLWLVDGQQRTRAMLDTFQQIVVLPKRSDDLSLVGKEDLEYLRKCGKELMSEHEARDHDDSTDEDTYENVENELCWMVVLPAMPDFEQYFGTHSESRNVQRGSMFRRLCPRPRTRLTAKDKKQLPMPALPPGIVPLASLLNPKGVFHDESQRREAFEAVNSFLKRDASDRLMEALDKNLPWGPQFVTGYAYESSNKPMCWSHLNARRDEPDIIFMLCCLLGLFSPQCRWSAVLERFRGMWDGKRFAIGSLPRSDMSAAIDAYIRINRAGIRVRAEERAMALLSRARPNILDDLADFTHRRDGNEGSIAKDRRTLLAHESDRQMGFAVWMTTVTRYTAIAVLGDSARRWLGLSAIDKSSFGYRLDRIRPKETEEGPKETKKGRSTWSRGDYTGPGAVIEECIQRATPALVLLDSIMTKELTLDHRMARPSPRALYPLIDLFYRIPSSKIDLLAKDDTFRAAIGRLLLWTFLVPYLDQSDLEQLTVDVHGIDEEAARKKSEPISCWDGDTANIDEEIQSALKRYQSSLLSLWRGKYGESAEGTGALSLAELALKAFSIQVKEARSLQHAAVGWLYAIERRGGAREFSWEAQFEGFEENGEKVGIRRRALTEAEDLRASSDDALYPEKQHIVPFSIARQIVNKGGTRATASPSNAIGNLTWLSRRQNGFEGLGDRWAVMDRKRDGDNLQARGMTASVELEGRQRDARALYEELQGIIVPDDSWRENLDKEKAQRLLELYEAFCKARSDWMIEKMREWLNEPLGEGALRWLRMS